MHITCTAGNYRCPPPVTPRPPLTPWELPWRPPARKRTHVSPPAPRTAQVNHCLEDGIEAALWNSSTSDLHKANVLKELASSEPDLRLLYTTPESLLKPQLRDALKVRHEALAVVAAAASGLQAHTATARTALPTAWRLGCSVQSSSPDQVHLTTSP